MFFLHSFILKFLMLGVVTQAVIIQAVILRAAIMQVVIQAVLQQTALQQAALQQAALQQAVHQQVVHQQVVHQQAALLQVVHLLVILLGIPLLELLWVHQHRLRPHQGRALKVFFEGKFRNPHPVLIYFRFALLVYWLTIDQFAFLVNQDRLLGKLVKLELLLIVLPLHKFQVQEQPLSL